MSQTPSTVPRSVHLVHVRAPQLERGDAALRARTARLAGLHGVLSYRAVVLAFLADAASARERQAYDDATATLEHAAQVFADLRDLPPAFRLPWFEHFATLLAREPQALRHEVIDSARRVLVADGIVTPLDQLRWVALRRLLAGTAVAPPVAAPTELEALDDLQAQSACVFSGFLSQLVPAPELTLDLSAEGGSISQAWYDGVTAPWSDRPGGVPPRASGQDVDASLRALRVLQGLPWMQRPILVRTWFDSARVLTDGPTLHHDAADALRLACVLLDSPVPAELGRQYSEAVLHHH